MMRQKQTPSRKVLTTPKKSLHEKGSQLKSSQAGVEKLSLNRKLVSKRPRLEEEEEEEDWEELEEPLVDGLASEGEEEDDEEDEEEEELEKNPSPVLQKKRAVPSPQPTPGKRPSLSAKPPPKKVVKTSISIWGPLKKRIERIPLFAEWSVYVYHLQHSWVLHGFLQIKNHT